MTVQFALAVAILTLSRSAWCTQGDICYIVGPKTALVDNKLYFMSGNYSTVSFGGQNISPAASLYSLNISNQFPVERPIPKALLGSSPIESSVQVAYNSAQGASDTTGALWHTNDTIYVFGGGFEKARSTVSAYDVATGNWRDVSVRGGAFTFGNRSSSQYVSVPGSGLHFVYGGTSPYMGGMIRLDSSDPERLSWTNETLGNGSHGIPVPNLESGALVYLPAGKQGLLVSFGGSNATEGINPDWGWPYDSDWRKIYVYDIASHTWWKQDASGDPPSHRGSFCTAVTVSPDTGAFHITTYGGWSLNDGRSYEDVHVLNIPSFVWIDATELSNQTNKEQQINSTIGRDSLGGSCQTYNGAQMIVIGGAIKAGAYSFTNGACSNVFEPVRVLDLSTYQWKIGLDDAASYQVPRVIYDKIGGSATGGATLTVPSDGFADPTLSSVLQLRVATPTSSSTISHKSSDVSTSEHQSKTVEIGVIVGGVLGGVAGLVLVCGITWCLLRPRAQAPVKCDHHEGEHGFSGKPELEASHIHELNADQRPAQFYELSTSPTASRVETRTSR